MRFFIRFPANYYANTVKFDDTLPDIAKKDIFVDCDI